MWFKPFKPVLRETGLMTKWIENRLNRCEIVDLVGKISFMTHFDQFKPYLQGFKLFKPNGLVDHNYGLNVSKWAEIEILPTKSTMPIRLRYISWL
jgi:hypothetical protein